MKNTLLKVFIMVAMALLSIPHAARAQVNTAIMFPIVGRYVQSLQSGDNQALGQLTDPFLFQRLMLLTTGDGVFPILRDLGPIANIQLGPSVSPFNFTVRIQHQRGTSEWQFVLNTDSKVVLAAELLRVTFQGSASSGPSGVLPGAAPRTGANSELGNVFGGRPGGAIVADLARPDTFNPIPPRNSPGPTPGAPAPSTTVSMPCVQVAAACGARPRTFTNDPRLVEFLFMTDRVPQNGTQAVSFSGDRQSSFSFGAVSVHVPETHKIGRIELPSTWKVWGIELRHDPIDEKKHFVIRQLQIMTLDAWGDLIRKTQARSALIFVHGFNTGFLDAVYRNAQIIYDLDYRGLSILYSWSSRGGALNYRYDIDSAYSGRDGFIFLLKKLREEYGIQRVDVLAHSMGNLLVLDALKNSSATEHPARVDQLMMAAPDVPRDSFERQLPEIQKISAGTTLYASAADKALAASKLLAIYPRAGDVPDIGPVILPNLDTIDVTAIGDEFLGLNHTEFATNRSVMDDLRILLDTQQRASRLNQIKAYPETQGGPHYWRYVP
ncbi:alpha/beta hydrolase [Bradyrhizobium sp. Arg68]|uniref:alpha/beta hydrolase n=1 Tax=Bradyrhizobium ivorense TaxID=2511166 RepID=UPI001E4EB9A3|nr:alpha/beta hydrolase [Bradyrhizobium ivorense]MCC8936016.1 alpha/beta hydrolase [Bradyrhizobium ivorense]